MEVLGKEATPREPQAEVKKRFRIDMTADHAKAARYEILKRAGEQNSTPAANTATASARPGPNGAALPAATEKVSKKEAVRRSLAKLGKDAETADIQREVKVTYGLDMTS